MAHGRAFLLWSIPLKLRETFGQRHPFKGPQIQENLYLVGGIKEAVQVECANFI